MPSVSPTVSVPSDATTTTDWTVVLLHGSTSFTVNERGVPLVALEGLSAEAPAGREGVAANAIVKV